MSAQPVMVSTSGDTETEEPQARTPWMWYILLMAFLFTVNLAVHLQAPQIPEGVARWIMPVTGAIAALLTLFLVKARMLKMVFLLVPLAAVGYSVWFGLLNDEARSWVVNHRMTVAPVAAGLMALWFWAAFSTKGWRPRSVFALLTGLLRLLFVAPCLAVMFVLIFWQTIGDGRKEELRKEYPFVLPYIEWLEKGKQDEQVAKAGEGSKREESPALADPAVSTDPKSEPPVLPKNIPVTTVGGPLTKKWRETVNSGFKSESQLNKQIKLLALDVEVAHFKVESKTRVVNEARTNRVVSSSGRAQRFLLTSEAGPVIAQLIEELAQIEEELAKYEKEKKPDNDRP